MPASQAGRRGFDPRPPLQFEIRNWKIETRAARGITPADYKPFGWEEDESGAFHDPKFLQPYEERGEPVQVGEGGQRTVRLKLIPAPSGRP